MCYETEGLPFENFKSSGGEHKHMPHLGKYSVRDICAGELQKQYENKVGNVIF